MSHITTPLCSVDGDNRVLPDIEKIKKFKLRVWTFGTSIHPQHGLSIEMWYKKTKGEKTGFYQEIKLETVPTIGQYRRTRVDTEQSAHTDIGKEAGVTMIALLLHANETMAKELFWTYMLNLTMVSNINWYGEEL